MFRYNQLFHTSIKIVPDPTDEIGEGSCLCLQTAFSLILLSTVFPQTTVEVACSM